jgi:hypothetical protein
MGPFDSCDERTSIEKLVAVIKPEGIISMAWLQGDPYIEKHQLSSTVTTDGLTRGVSAQGVVELH